MSDIKRTMNTSYLTLTRQIQGVYGEYSRGSGLIILTGLEPRPQGSQNMSYNC